MHVFFLLHTLFCFELAESGFCWNLCVRRICLYPGGCVLVSSILTCIILFVAYMYFIKSKLFSHAPYFYIFSGNSMADYDADGFLDLYMAYGRFGPDRLYRNNGDMTWSDVTEEAGLLTEGNLGDDGAGNTCGVAFADLNGDGYPELITSNCSSSEGRPATINFNNGDGTFEEAVALPAAMPVGFFMGIAIGDVDHDGDFDIFLTDVGAQTFEPSYFHSLLLNNGDGTFVDATPEDLPQNEWGWSASFEDFDNNGSVDLLYTGSGIFTAFVNFNRGHLLMNDGAGLLAEDSTCPPFDCTTCTANNILGNQPDLCYTPELCQLRDASTGTWTGAAEFCNEIAVGCDECYRSRSTCAFEVEEEPACVRSLGVDLATSRSGGHAVGDIDGDGFDEIAIMNSNYAEDYSYFFNQTDYVMPGAINHVVLLKNSGNDNNSIRLRLVGTKSNRNGIGSLLTCDDGSNKMQYLQVRAVSGPFSPTQFFPSFGIGKMNSATIAIQWPSGLNEKFVDVQANMLITLEEGTGSVMEGDGIMSSENDAIYPERGDESSAPDDSAPTDTSNASFLLPPEFFYGAPLSFIFFAFY